MSGPSTQYAPIVQKESDLVDFVEWKDTTYRTLWGHTRTPGARSLSFDSLSVILKNNTQFGCAQLGPFDEISSGF